MIRVLFICHGNICRSVMAEYIFKYKHPNMECESRAVSNEETGNDIYPPAKRCLDSHHIPYQRHYAKKITEEDYDHFDKIYVMDQSNLRIIHRLLEDKDHKIFLLDEREIDDPWYTGDFEGVYQQIFNAIDKIELQ